MTATTPARMTYATIKRCCEINPGVKRIEDVGSVRIACVYRPPMAYGRIDKRALRDAVAPEFFYVWTAQEGDMQPWVVNDPENVIALLGGEPLESVRARVAGENQLPLFAFTPKRER